MIQNESLDYILTRLYYDDELYIDIDINNMLVIYNDNKVKFDISYEFYSNILPRIVISFLSLGNVDIRKLIYNEKGNIVLEYLKKKIVLRNVNEETIIMVDNLSTSISKLRDKTVIDNRYDEYVTYQLINNYSEMLRDTNSRIVKKIKANESVNTDTYKKEIVLVEIEKNNEKIINNNADVLTIMKAAAKNNASYNNVECTNYYTDKIKAYEIKKDKKKKEICGKILVNSRLEELKGDNNMAKKSAVKELKSVKKKKENFSNIINNPIEEPEHLFTDSEHQELQKGAAEQARMLLEVMNERDSIKRDAEEFAKTIIEKQKERKQLLHAAEEQARRIIALEKENDELKKMAEENARIIFDQELQQKREIIKDANEYAKIIFDKQQERNSLVKAAEEQARRIIALEKENDELKKMAQQNAKYIFDETMMQDEKYLAKSGREYAKEIFERQQERDALIKAAQEQAKRIIALEKENDELKRLAEENARLIFDKELKQKQEIINDANEYAKIIYAKQEERKSLLKAAEEQARRIIALEKENNELRRLAEENAKNIFNRENRYKNELRLKEMVESEPMTKSDIDKLYALLNALSGVEDISFTINHPTVMQQVIDLETKIEAYISTHKVVEDIKPEVTITEKENKQTNKELLGILRNAYVQSHNYEKEGRHSVINVTPELNKIKVTLYSVKNDTDDILTEVYFDEDFFDENTIRELCDIYSSGTVVVASKTDNIPGNLQDYLVIDNQDNAIKFMGCKRDIIERAKAYL